MSVRSKLQKVKKKLKKAKSKIKSLKSKNNELKNKVNSTPQTEKAVVAIDTSNGQLSKDLNAKEVIAYFQNMTDADAITKFIKGEKRPSVVQRAKSRINALAKAAIEQ